MKQLTYILAFVLLCASRTFAFDNDAFASESVLAQGRWVKVSVQESGMHIITNDQLRQWGFSDPKAVRLYGYGGARKPDQLSMQTYIDDLPLTPCEYTDRGIVFYAVGPESWERSLGGVFINNSNIYTQAGYYFLSDTQAEPPALPQAKATPSARADSTYYYMRKAHHEYDRVSPGEAGYLLAGESFKVQSAHKFSFDLPADSVAMEVGIISNTSSPATVQFTVNGQPLAPNPSDNIPITSSSTYQHGTLTISNHRFSMPGQKIELTVQVQGASSMRDCWLDFIAINSFCTLQMTPEGTVDFIICGEGRLGNASEDTRLWEISSPQRPQVVPAGYQAGALAWTMDDADPASTAHAYVAWSPKATMPSPKLVGTVQNQNLHAMQPCDMVIITLPAYMAQAQRLASLHSQAQQPLKVEVVDVNKIYEEFGSGSPDISALRLFLKMLYDRSKAPDSEAKLQYALLFGRATYDHRRLTSQFDDPNSFGTIPMWMGGDRRSQLSDNTAFGTDDFIAMLEDGSGANLGRDVLSIAVGRMPVRSADEARSAVDKLQQYMHNNRTGTWRNSFLFLADDGNMGIHVEQTERVINNILNTPGSQAFISKVYVDSYDIIAGSCEGGRADMYRMLDEGVVWWCFSGHANNHSWTGENMLTYNDINNMYLTRLPVLLAATCDFLRWDSNTVSGGEIMWKERYGGSIATISATRPVYITDNGYFTAAMGRAMTARNDDGSMLRLGDIYRVAKNDIRNDSDIPVSNTNRLRYVLMGDPALQLAMPGNLVAIDAFGDQPVTPDSQATLKALQRTTVSGRITAPDGSLLDDFDGTVEIVIYDAEESSCTKGNREDNVRIIFERHGNRLYAGSAPVKGGLFTANIAMPGEVADNFRPAAMNMYARSADGRTEAVGLNTDFYVFGLDETVPDDNVAPTIDWLVLNHESFSPGDIVNASPMVLARISDDVGINLSTAGVGHQMTITLDDKRTFTDVSLFFQPSADGSPSGTISYPMEDLPEGPHTMRLRIWDTNGNSAQQDISFSVDLASAPKIYDIRTDANPAVDQANFYISHDRPDGQVTVTVEIFSLNGRKVWESTVSGRSDMFLSAPVTWDLTDSGGRRVPRGIYLYRATISEVGGEKYDTGSRKIAVAAQQ